MQKETLLEYLQRKIKRQRGDYKNKILFSQRILNPYLKVKYRFSKDYKNALAMQLDLIENAIVDPNGIGGINLKLHNAHVPKRYYDIFYRIFREMGGGNPKITIDCGAHAGLVTDLLLDCGAVVHLFEPNDILFPILQNKYKNNKNVILHKAALSNKDGKAKFMLNDSISQGNRLDSSGDYNEGYDEYYEVEVIDLVRYINENILNTNDRIYFLKLDIEGAEFDIIDKIIETKLYEKIDYIACETHERYFIDGKNKITNLKRLIKEHNINNILLDWI
ncbi:FkbM family methyltransferase [Helicobacter sp. MIT 99-5507]|uniref:FkbM family methyltransferase n=1 Tax=Helicobacter sp. MIT 99-5507 TaxID=152489 RepID=UPI0015F18F57|nr:FkbM family methyltransferase [Helicobacter sp. MIT 99-5507]